MLSQGSYNNSGPSPPATYRTQNRKRDYPICSPLRGSYDTSGRSPPTAYRRQNRRHIYPICSPSIGGGVPRKQNLLKGNLPRVIYHQAT